MMAPAVGFEPTTNGLTVRCATAAPRRNIMVGELAGHRPERNRSFHSLAWKQTIRLAYGKAACRRMAQAAGLFPKGTPRIPRENAARLRCAKVHAMRPWRGAHHARKHRYVSLLLMVGRLVGDSALPADATQVAAAARGYSMGVYGGKVGDRSHGFACCAEMTGRISMHTRPCRHFLRMLPGSGRSIRYLSDFKCKNKVAR